MKRKTMHIIILGAGDIGYTLAKMLSYEQHNIVLIEKDQQKYQHATENLDAQVLLADGTSYKVLEKAGIQNTDMLVAVTNSDEVNILSAIMAKQYKVPKTIARVKNKEFLHTQAPVNAQKFGIDLIIHPESEAANGAISLLKQSAATDIIEFAEGRIALVGIQLDLQTPFLGKSLIDLARQYGDFPFRIVAIQRKDHTKIPRGSDVFLANDRIFVVLPKNNIADLIKISGKENTTIENVMILGGGQTGFLIARELEKQYNVKIIESNTDKSTELAERLHKTLVIKGDGRDLNLLALEGIIDMDAFISVTGDDETNIISCLMAKHLQVPKIISLINKADYTPIIPTIGIDAYISKQMITVNSILKFIRRSTVVSVVTIPGISAEAIELVPNEHAKITRLPVHKLTFPKDAILGAVKRGKEVFIPVGDSQIMAGDKVVLFTLPSAIYDLEKFFD